MNQDQSNDGASSVYTADSLEVVEGLEYIRRRPQMYVGNTRDGSGLQRMFEIFFAHGLFEWGRNETERLCVHVHADNSMSLAHDGPGLDMQPRGDEPSLLELVAQRMLVRGRSKNCAADSRARWLGCTGIEPPLAVVNALSRCLRITSVQEGECRTVLFGRGKIIETVTAVPGPSSGTVLRMWPDPEIFIDACWDIGMVQKALDRAAFLNPGLRTRLEVEPRSYVALESLCDLLDRRAGPQGLGLGPTMLECCHGDFRVRVALAWRVPTRPREQAEILSFCNQSPLADGGTHVQGLESGVRGTLADFVQDHDLGDLRACAELLCQRWLLAAVAVDHDEPRFTDFRRRALINEELKSAVHDCIVDQLAPYLEAHAAQLIALLRMVDES